MIDATDRKILDVLARDGGLTGAALGDRIGLSPSATQRRVALLEERGFILGYRAILSQEARGCPSVVVLVVTLHDQQQETLARFEAALARCNCVVEAHLMSGDFDYLLKVEVPDSDSYERLHRSALAVLPGVKRLVSHFSIRSVPAGGAR